jgi:hypothetical protein
MPIGGLGLPDLGAEMTRQMDPGHQLRLAMADSEGGERLSTGGGGNFPAPIPEVTPEEESTWTAKILAPISAAANLLGVPGAMVRNLVAGESPWAPLASPFSDEGRVSGRDLLRRWGMAGPEDTWGNFAGGLATEFALDPLTLVAGVGGLSKAGKLAKVLSAAPEALQEAAAAAKGFSALGKTATIAEKASLAGKVVEGVGATADALQDASKASLLRSAAQTARDALLAGRPEEAVTIARKASWQVIPEHAFDVFLGSEDAPYAARHALNILEGTAEGPVLGTSPVARAAQWRGGERSLLKLGLPFMESFAEFGTGGAVGKGMAWAVEAANYGRYSPLRVLRGLFSPVTRRHGTTFSALGLRAMDIEADRLASFTGTMRQAMGHEGPIGQRLADLHQEWTELAERFGASKSPEAAETFFRAAAEARKSLEDFDEIATSAGALNETLTKLGGTAIPDIAADPAATAFIRKANETLKSLAELNNAHYEAARRLGARGEVLQDLYIPHVPRRGLEPQQRMKPFMGRKGPFYSYPTGTTGLNEAAQHVSPTTGHSFYTTDFLQKAAKDGDATAQATITALKQEMFDELKAAGALPERWKGKVPVSLFTIQTAHLVHFHYLPDLEKAWGVGRMGVEAGEASAPLARSAAAREGNWVAKQVARMTTKTAEKTLRKLDAAHAAGTLTADQIEEQLFTKFWQRGPGTKDYVYSQLLDRYGLGSKEEIARIRAEAIAAGAPAAGEAAGVLPAVSEAPGTMFYKGVEVTYEQAKAAGLTDLEIEALNKAGVVAPKILQSRAKKLLRYMVGRPAEFAGRPLFEPDILEAYIDAMQYNTARLATMHGAHEMLRLPGVLKPVGSEPGLIPLENAWGGITRAEGKRIKLSTGQYGAGFETRGLRALMESMGYAPGDFAKYAVDDSTAMALRNYGRAMQSQEVGAFGKAVDRVLSFFRGPLYMIWPASQVRNLISDASRGWNSGRVGTAAYAQELIAAGRYVMSGGESGLSREIVQEMKDMGVWAGAGLETAVHGMAGGRTMAAQYAPELIRGRVSSGLASLKKSGEWLPWRMFHTRGMGVHPTDVARTGVPENIGVLGQLGESMHATSDFIARGGFYSALRKGGYGPAQAAQITRQVMFDYREMSAFERDIVRRAGPLFFSWTRKNVPYTFEQILAHPRGRTAWMLRSLGEAAQHPPTGQAAYTPGFVKERGGFPVTTEDGSATYLTATGLPVEDINALLAVQPGYPFIRPGRTWEKLAAQLNPITGSIIESIAGKQLFTGRPLEYLQSPTEQYLGRRLGPIDFLLARGPESRLVSTAQMVADPRKALWQRMLNLGSGVKFATYEPEKWRDIDVADQMRQQLAENPMVRHGGYNYIPDQYLAQVGAETPALIRRQRQVEILLGRHRRQQRLAAGQEVLTPQRRRGLLAQGAY